MCARPKAKLLRERLIKEMPSRGTLPVWRHDDKEGSLALCITKDGLAAIGIDASVSELTSKAPPETRNGSDLAPKQPRRVQPASRKKSKDEGSNACQNQYRGFRSRTV